MRLNARFASAPLAWADWLRVRPGNSLLSPGYSWRHVETPDKRSVNRPRTPPPKPEWRWPSGILRTSAFGLKRSFANYWRE